MVAVLASMIFAAISGSATAGTAAIGSIMTPAFKEKGYNMRFRNGSALSSRKYRTDYSAKYLNGSDWIFHRCICWSVIPQALFLEL